MVGEGSFAFAGVYDRENVRIVCEICNIVEGRSSDFREGSSLLAYEAQKKRKNEEKRTQTKWWQSKALVNATNEHSQFFVIIFLTVVDGINIIDSINTDRQAYARRTTQVQSRHGRGSMSISISISRGTGTGTGT